MGSLLETPEGNAFATRGRQVDIKGKKTRHRAASRIRLLLAAAAAVVLAALVWAPLAGAGLPQLTRYPYLTDVVSDGGAYDATINWATDQSQAAGYATFGRQGAEPVTAHRAGGSRTAITVNGVPEYQWKAVVTGLLPDTAYSYRVFFDSPVVDLLGADTSPTFVTPHAPGSAGSFSFAVLGDWGATDAAGAQPYQADLDALIADSGVSFALSTGDIAYPNGSQTNYGDLLQTGPNISTVFAPGFYKAIGDGIPMFVAPGNHGFNATTLNVWPADAAAALSGGRDQMDSYNVPGTNTASYPSVWYAFSVGTARFYVLTAAWGNSNVGAGTIYSRDQAAHWTPSSAEYQWLAGDLATNPAPLKFAVFHFPMYSDNTTETTDPYLHGPDSLAALLSQHGVQFVFNGHAHIYERNLRQPGESFVSYVTGGGGAALQPVNRNSPFDAYALGWSTSTGTGSAGGSAPVPDSAAKVFHYLRVTVDGGQVTVRPINALGQSFDVVTYTVSGPIPDTTPPITIAAGAVGGRWYRRTVSLTLSTIDNVGGSGVARTEYSLDGGPWTRGTSISVSTQGRHTLLYFSRDNAGNDEPQRSLDFGIDTVRPTTKAPSAASARRGGTASLRYRVSDPKPHAGKATVTIKVRNRAGRVVETLGPAQRAVNKLLTWKFRVPRSWRSGTRHFTVYARDLAGNRQTLPAGRNKLVVR
jgi:hypothetical protein